MYKYLKSTQQYICETRINNALGGEYTDFTPLYIQYHEKGANSDNGWHTAYTANLPTSIVVSSLYKCSYVIPTWKAPLSKSHTVSSHSVSMLQWVPILYINTEYQHFM